MRQATTHPKKIFIIIALFLSLFLVAEIFTSSNPIDGYEFEEVDEINGVEWNLDQYESYFRSLAEEKSAVYAFDVLRRVKIPVSINIHEIGHGIGYILYRQNGLEGLKSCTEEFRSACAHSLVISHLITFGTQAMIDVESVCRNAPGGKGAYSLCFHAVGHGLLAYAQYDFEKAVNLCTAVKYENSTSNDSESNQLRGYRFVDPEIECVGGVVMEMVAASHDRVAWATERKKFMPKNEIHMPCNSLFMPDRFRSICYTYITERFISAAGVTETLPTNEDIENAMEYCNLIQNSEIRISCFGGFGKLFVFYANQGSQEEMQGNYVDRMSDQALEKVHSWCSLTHDIEGEHLCNGIALDTIFWIGQNSPIVSISFCKLSLTDSEGIRCFDRLVSNIHYFIDDASTIESTCLLFPDDFRSGCSV